MPKLMPMTAKERVRFSGSVTSEMYACARTRFPAVSPSMIRARYTTQSVPAPARRSREAKVPSWETMSSGFRPVRSLQRPRNGPLSSWQNA